jgi:hypothetical protein
VGHHAVAIASRRGDGSFDIIQACGPSSEVGTASPSVTTGYVAPVAYLLAAILGLAFGAGDQFLGSRTVTLGPWAATAAQMSAPWLVLPFVIGTTQERPRRAAVLGLVVTTSALLGYFAMTYSPVEIHPWTFHRFTTGMVAVTTRGWYNPVYILGGLVTGPLFGLLGQRWRVRRSWVSATLVAGALCLEPLARWGAGQLMPPAPVWTIEVVSGSVVAALFALAILAWRRAAPATRQALPGS